MGELYHASRFDTAWTQSGSSAQLVYDFRYRPLTEASNIRIVTVLYPPDERPVWKFANVIFHFCTSKAVNLDHL